MREERVKELLGEGDVAVGSCCCSVADYSSRERLRALLCLEPERRGLRDYAQSARDKVSTVGDSDRGGKRYCSQVRVLSEPCWLILPR